LKTSLAVVIILIFVIAVAGAAVLAYSGRARSASTSITFTSSVKAGTTSFGGVFTTVTSNASSITSGQTTSSSASLSSTCVIAGQAGGLELRILSNSTGEPVSGVVVTATNSPALCNGFPTTTQSETEFTTNSSTEWYSLPTGNDGSYSLALSYLDENYTLQASLMPMFTTCATLYLPSGTTNVTIGEFRSSCSSSPFYIASTTMNLVSCPDNYPNGVDPADAPAIRLQENSTAYLCVRLYYYNPNSTMLLYVPSILGIAGYRSFNSSFSNGFDASYNFTLISSPTNITLGGPQNLNEGVMVSFVIHANLNSNGTYNYGFQATNYPSFETCDGLGQVIVGNSSPNYNVGFGSCTAALTNSRNSEGFVDGILFAELVGVTNSTSS